MNSSALYVLLLAVLLLSGCNSPSDSNSDSDSGWDPLSASSDLAATPKLASKLEERGVLGETGLLRIYLYDANDVRIELTGKDLPDDGKDIETWSWEKTPTFNFTPDSIRNKLDTVAEKNPPDGHIMPDRLMHFLLDIDKATQ